MFDLIYVEQSVKDHPRVGEILGRYRKAPVVECDRYGEVFNRRAQNFRLQKNRPALVLAKKHGNLVLDVPSGYGVGSNCNYYFSHMLNCVYDCRYCFLQGMFRSAHLVLFVNYEDFHSAIDSKIATSKEDSPFFFSGYDCDSLALDPLSRFTESFLPLFERHPEAYLELRTKSAQVRSLLGRPALGNCVVAFSLTPEPFGDEIEAGVPPLSRRLEAMESLGRQGWPIGLRFDPLILYDDFEVHYRRLFEKVFASVKVDALHSVSLGAFRMPKDIYKNAFNLYPDEKLLSYRLEEKRGVVSYPDEISQRLHDTCRQGLLEYVPREKLFACESI